MVRLRFSIGLHEKDFALLERIQKFFGVGKIYRQGPQLVTLRVESLKEIAIIITHFNNYPLITQKHADFELFQQAFELIKNEKHLTLEGLNKIAGLKEIQNWGLSPKLEDAFPNRTSENRPLVLDKIIPNPFLLAGFTAAEGSFMINLTKSNAYLQGFKVQLVFQLTQHRRDDQLLISLIKYFNCGNVFQART